MKSSNPELIIRMAEIKANRSVNLKVPLTLTSPDPIVQKAQQEFKEKTWLQHGLRMCFNTLDIHVSPGNMDRGLRIMDTIIKALKARGHVVEHRNRESYTVIKGELIPISFREKLKVLPQNDSYGGRILEPTGILSFRSKIDYSAREWMDKSERVELQLLHILAQLELYGERLAMRSIEHENKMAQQRALEQIKREIRQRQEDELSKFNSVLNEAKRWHEARILRDYADQVRDEQWKTWIKKKADWYDPQVSTEDELLENVDKITLRLNTAQF